MIKAYSETSLAERSRRNLQLLNQVSGHCSENITKTFSTSFSLASRLLRVAVRRGIYAIYGFVRLADEVVDTLHDCDQLALLTDFKTETFKAIERGVSLNPVLHSFQHCVRKYSIGEDLIEAFFRSMEADLSCKQHDQCSYRDYVYGSAEVVGLMCLRVFADGDDAMYLENVAGARALGAAFQKVNFLRDFRDDFEMLGRCYFPGVDPNQFLAADKKAIEADIEKDFQIARAAIAKLPAAARLGVSLAYVYYYALFRRLRAVSPEQVRAERIRVSEGEKLFLFIRTCCRSCVGQI